MDKIPEIPKNQPFSHEWGDALLAFTERFKDASSFSEAATLLHQIVAPNHGLLARLEEFFRAASEKVTEAEQRDAGDLHWAFRETADDIEELSGRLDEISDRVRVLTTPHQDPKKYYVSELPPRRPYHGPPPGRGR